MKRGTSGRLHASGGVKGTSWLNRDDTYRPRLFSKAAKKCSYFHPGTEKLRVARSLIVEGGTRVKKYYAGVHFYAFFLDMAHCLY